MAKKKIAAGGQFPAASVVCSIIKRKLHLQIPATGIRPPATPQNLPAIFIQIP